MNKRSLVLIQNQYDRLTGAEKKLAEYVLACPEQAMTLTAAQLAARAGVAASAVIRFCKKLGFEGLSAFRLSLAGELGEKRENKLLPASEGDLPQTVLQKVFATGVKTLQDTAAMMQEQPIEEVVAALVKANKICFFGVGTSSTIAMDAKYRLMQLGYQSASATDILYMKVAALNLHAGDVAVGISHSGKTAATIDALQTAKENGAQTIVITSYRESPVCSCADKVLTVYADDRNYPVEAFSARMAHICVLDAIAVALAMQDYDAAMRHLEEQRRVLKKIRGREK